MTSSQLIACDFFRYEDMVVDGELYHWDTLGDVVGENDQLYQAYSARGGGTRFTFAHRLTYEDDTDLPDLIQFCPVSRPSKLNNALHNLNSSTSSSSSLV